MQGPSTRRETEQQRTRRIFIFGIVLNHLSIYARLSNLLFADVPLDCAPERVTAEFKFSRGKLPPDLEVSSLRCGFDDDGLLTRRKQNTAAGIISRS